MFSKFKEFFRSDSLLDSAYDDTVKMLEFDYQMYQDSSNCLRRSDTTELPYDFKQADRKINKFEREVRRNVLTHMAISRPHDIVPCLVLITVVIDVERIGDYTKNIADIARRRKERLQGGQLEAELTAIESEIDAQFPTVIKLFEDRNRQEASSVLAEEETVASRSENIVKDLMTGKQSYFPSDTAVCLAMYARYLKRINAHLTNIASSVVNPFPRIGFREKKKSK